MFKRFFTAFTTLFLISIISFAQENGPLSCTDGVDNDGDGLIDCMDPECQTLSGNGCNICTDGISFADVLLEYTPGCATVDLTPEGAIGISDYGNPGTGTETYAFLGQGGVLKLGFTNNILINSGNSQEDVWVFEIGPQVEASSLAFKPADSFTLAQLILLSIPDTNSDGYFEMGGIGGSVSGFDIDIVMPGYAPGSLKFDAIEIVDVPNTSCSGSTPGADIDAVCALSSISVDCAGTPSGNAVIDDCGVCLEPGDPNFNSCLNCSSGRTFADELINYTAGCQGNADPSPFGAVGVNDYDNSNSTYTYLGEGGSIKLGFTDNQLVNSGNFWLDVLVFEIGPEVESSSLAFRPADAFTLAQLQLLAVPDIDSNGYFEMGTIGGAISGFDIDSVMPGYAAASLKFDAIEITDVVDDNCSSSTPGADIDAVCALSSIDVCGKVVNLSVTDILPSSVTLRWETIDSVFGYQIQGRKIGAPLVTIIVSNGNVDSFIVSNIPANSQYEWQVSAICASNGSVVGPPSDLNFFTTPVCPRVDSVWTTSITSNSATLNWESTSGGTGYRIQGRVNGGQIITLDVPAGTTSFPVFNLVPGATYEWAVYTRCGNKGVSLISDVDQFTTLPFSAVAKVHNDASAASWRIYPQPASSIITLDTDYISSNGYECTIVNALGQVIHHEPNITNGQLTIQTSSWQTGLYFALFDDGQSVISRKLLIHQE